MRIKIGDEITTTMGCKATGTVVKPFPKDECDDGTYYDFDRKTMVAVKWDDGAKGYALRIHIKRRD